MSGGRSAANRRTAAPQERVADLIEAHGAGREHQDQRPCRALQPDLLEMRHAPQLTPVDPLLRSHRPGSRRNGFRGTLGHSVRAGWLLFGMTQLELSRADWAEFHTETRNSWFHTRHNVAFLARVSSIDVDMVTFNDS
mgnify:CR=1 FL=1